MEAPKNVEKERKNNFDFIQSELDYINANARFNDRQQEIFDRLTDRRGRQKIVKIALEMGMSERTVSREIQKIKKKILRIL